MASILIVEDHDSLRSSISSCLETEGFSTLMAKDLAEAQLQLNQRPSLMVLDWMLPDGQGIDLLKQIRKAGSVLPVIFLTARADIFDKVLSLELGASDYMTKPFESRELIARVRARLRDAKATPYSQGLDLSHVKVGALAIDRIQRRVRFRDVEVALVKKEYDLLILFAESPEKVFSRDEILNKVWGYEVFPTTRTVDTHVMLLRQKLDDSLIETVRSVGYRFRTL